MKILKFGGSSVANAGNINRVIEILRSNTSSSERTVVVVSAFGGVTDLLLKAASLAELNSESYKEILQEIEK